MGCALLSNMTATHAQDTDNLPLHNGAPVGFTEDGRPFIGHPDAPVTLYEYSDYLCPYCDRHFQQTFPALLQSQVIPGNVKVVFLDFPIAALHPQAPLLAEAALCVAEHGAATFWAMHAKLFESRGRFARGAATEDILRSLAGESGAELLQYEQCMTSGRQKANVEAGISGGSALGFNATPSFQFVGPVGDSYTFSGASPVAKFNEWIDALHAGNAPPTPPPPELPFWASPEGLAPDPARPGFTMAGDPFKGDPGAAVVVVEFSDFQCESCKRHTMDAQPAIDESFIETGKVLWVFKNFPLRMHPNAPAAAAAAECAGEQEKFWEMKRLLFENSESWEVEEPDTVIISLAAEAELDVAHFEDCFMGRHSLERVLTDIYDAQGVASTTPTFVTLYNGRGHLMSGARDAEQFVEYLEKALETASKDE